MRCLLVACPAPSNTLIFDPTWRCSTKTTNVHIPRSKFKIQTHYCNSRSSQAVNHPNILLSKSYLTSVFVSSRAGPLAPITKSLQYTKQHFKATVEYCGTNLSSFTLSSIAQMLSQFIKCIGRCRW